jgi:hypothetical protein
MLKSRRSARCSDGRKGRNSQTRGMMTSHPSGERILAIDPTQRGFGYMVLEGLDFAVDWGVREVRGPKNPQSVRAVARLMRRYPPDALVVEDCRAKGRRRRERVRKLIDELIELAAAKGVRVHRVSRTKVRQVFARVGATNKHRIAGVIAVRFPEFTAKLPPVRKP